MNPLPKLPLFGFNFLSASGPGEVVEAIMQWADEGPAAPAFLITPNASHIVYYHERRHRDVIAFYRKAQFVLPDGMPLVWLSRLKNTSGLKARLTGSDLFPLLWQEIKARKMPAVLVLTDTNLGAQFRQDYLLAEPLVPIWFRPYDDAYITAFALEVAKAVMANKARFIFIGLNFPKQEKLGMEIARQLEVMQYDRQITIPELGASFEFYFGKKKRAPRWMQRSGLEWLYRLIQEPRRLGKRYTVDNFRFILLAIRELFAARK